MKASIFAFASLLTLSLCAEPAPTKFREVLTLNGEDEAKDTRLFTVPDHWRVTCKVEPAGYDFSIQVIVVPVAGVRNTEIINMNAPGTKSVTMRNAGTYRLSVIGFSANWRVTVEQEVKP
jgi:hypothetical protein